MLDAKGNILTAFWILYGVEVKFKIGHFLRSQADIQYSVDNRTASGSTLPPTPTQQPAGQPFLLPKIRLPHSTTSSFHPLHDQQPAPQRSDASGGDPQSTFSWEPLVLSQSTTGVTI